jgi:hypothetical protein
MPTTYRRRRFRPATAQLAEHMGLNYLFLESYTTLMSPQTSNRLNENRLEMIADGQK